MESALRDYLANGARPHQDYVIVRKIKAEEKTPSGIILPDGYRREEKAMEGIVVAKGPGRVDSYGKRRTEIMGNVEIGDHVVHRPYAEGESGFQDPEFCIIRIAEIDAVLTP